MKPLLRDSTQPAIIIKAQTELFGVAGLQNKDDKTQGVCWSGCILNSALFQSLSRCSLKTVISECVNRYGFYLHETEATQNCGRIMNVSFRVSMRVLLPKDSEESITQVVAPAVSLVQEDQNSVLLGNSWHRNMRGFIHGTHTYTRAHTPSLMVYRTRIHKIF
jgi:hypothetical protein